MTAVVPMVIDVLNINAQIDHQRATWGEVSHEIRDYSKLDLPNRLKTEQGAALLSAVDPFSYRKQLTQAKLIMLSTNDRYWPLDALNLYWSELPEPKRVLYVPNQGHGMQDIERVLGAVSAAHRYAASGNPLPSTTWAFAASQRTLDIQVKPDRPVRRVLSWSARSDTLDFRDARWSSRECIQNAGSYACSSPRSPEGYTAVFAETAFSDDDDLSSPLRQRSASPARTRARHLRAEERHTGHPATWSSALDWNNKSRPPYSHLLAWTLKRHGERDPSNTPRVLTRYS